VTQFVSELGRREKTYHITA